MKSLFAIVLVCAYVTAFSQTWNGTSSNDWNDAANWTPAIPTSADDVTIPSGTTYPPVIYTSPAAVCHNLNIQSGSTLTISTGGDLQLHGNLTVAGTFTHTAGTLELVGNVWQTIDSITVYDVRVNNDSGVILHGNLIVNDTLSLIKGIVATGSFMVDMHDTVSNKLAGGDTNAYIHGVLRRAVYDTGTYNFPVGSSSNYELAEVHFNNNSGKQNGGVDSLLAFYVPGDSGCTGISGSGPVVNGTVLTDLLDAGYWTIHPDTNTYTNVNYNITVHEKGAGNAPANPQSCALVKRPACDSAWVSLGLHSNNTQSVTNGVIKAARSQLTSFSDFGIGFGNGGDVALPVEMLYLQAYAVNNLYIQLAWAVANEFNNRGFDIERSEDAQTWFTVGTVNSNGNSNQQVNYTFNDMGAIYNVSYYYRLKQVDINGNSKYVGIVTAMLNSDAVLFVGGFVPNPTSSTAYLMIRTKAEEEITMDVYSLIGQKVSSGKYSIAPGSDNKIELDVQHFPTGIYSAVITTGSGIYTKRLEVGN